MKDFDLLIAELPEKKNYTFDDLCDMVTLLRSEKGCPWDREQTNKSIRNAIIDETYEFIEGLDNNDEELMCEELGDVLFQVVFHASLKANDEKFGVGDVINGICRKMILRHPHVFSTVTVSDTSEVLDNWEKIKNVEKQRKTPFQQLESVSRALPSLMRTQKLQSKAEKTGLSDRMSSDEYIQQASDCMDKLKKGNNGDENIAELLFCAVGIARSRGCDAEELLYKRNENYIKELENADDASKIDNYVIK